MAQVTATAAAYAYISGAWTLLDDITPAYASWGMSSNSPTDLVADTGEMSFALNNSSGIYSPNGPSALTGWKKGIPFKVVITYDGDTWVRFRGIISDIQIRPSNKDKKAYITVLDWMDYAARHPIVNPGILTSKRGDQVLTTVMSEVKIQPQVTDFDTGIETFPTVFDTVTSKTKAYSEFVKVAMSELGRVYRRSDRVNGETIVFESADARHSWRTADNIVVSSSAAGRYLKEDGFYLLKEDGFKLILDQTEAPATLGSGSITGFDAPYGEHVINRMTVYANPRKLDASPQVLFQLNQEIVIGSGQTLSIKGTYADPSGGLPINAQSMITPVITTDYTMFTATGGGGSNISSSLAITPGYGTEGFTHSVTNNNAATGYINLFKCRGTGIYLYNPIEHAATDSSSINEFETESEYINQKYKNDLSSGSVFVNSVVDEFRQPRTVLNSINFCANSSNSAMMLFLNTDIGDLRYIDIAEAGVSGNYYIQGIEFEIDGGLIMVKWIVVLALSLQTSCGLSPISVEFNTTGTTDRVSFSQVPRLNNISKVSISTWIYMNAATTSEVVALWDGLTLGVSPVSRYAWWYQLQATSVGSFATPNLSLTLGQWTHIVWTRDTSTSPTTVPVIYINAVSQAITTVIAPSGAVTHDLNVFQIGGAYSGNPLYAKLFDFRVYDNVILTSSQVSEIYNAGVPSASVLTGQSTGLVFQPFAVRTGSTASYIGQTLTSTLTLRDAVFGAVGVPNGSPIGRAAP